MFDPNRVYKIVNRQTGECLEIGGGDRYRNGKIANLWGYWGGANQQWIIESSGQSGKYRIINRNSKQELSVGSSNTGYSISGTINYQEYNAIQNYSSSIYIYKSSNGYRIKAFNFGTELQLSFGPRTVGYGSHICFSSRYTEVWDIVDVSTNPGVYQIINANSWKALSATADDNRVTQWTNWSLAGQQWLFEPVGNDPSSQYPGHKLWAVHVRTDNRVLEIGGSERETMQPGRQANTWDFWNQDLIRSNQLWRILDDNGNDFNPSNPVGPYHLLNVRTNLALEIGGNGSELTREDRAANQWEYWGGTNQKWYISYVSANRSSSGSTITATTAIQKEKPQLTLYPNPANEQLTISLTSSKVPVSIQVTDAKGNTQTMRLQPNGQLNLSNLSSGIYILRVSDGLRSYQQKFVKQ